MAILTMAMPAAHRPRAARASACRGLGLGLGLGLGSGSGLGLEAVCEHRPVYLEHVIVHGGHHLVRVAARVGVRVRVRVKGEGEG